ncbi:hypothetical protein A3N57_03000 [Enterobacter cloacae subsp. dissolvens]|uniref:hypothetical protein n=1 Tax=Enterobacter cloacae TaxID=550 RepID=UPI0007B37896|nr:hypothetical protein [Enterobacter cloacae]KZQ38026.1 hypothetical protein A3N57_03000 [Enterobacter cloacae subsp. dissolvens]HBI6862933.1 hypothetical protein [Enterobacter pasteurii]
MFSGVKVLESLITDREIDIFYRYLAISKNMGALKGNTDNADAHMYFAVPLGEAMLSHFNSLMKDIVGEDVYPSYSFLWNYKKGYVLPKHKDRNSVDYIISIGLHSHEESDWGIFVDGEEIKLSVGDAMVLDGKKFEHWREACPYENRLQLILCYTRDVGQRFDRRQHLGFDPIPEVITSPLNRGLTIEDRYVATLGENDV